MIQIAYSELTKRYYFLPLKGNKIDITDDIKEIIAAHQLPPAQPLTTDEEAAEKCRQESASALAWMKAQAKALNPDVKEDWSVFYLARVIAGYIHPTPLPALTTDEEAAKAKAISEWGNEDYHEDERRNYENGFTDGCTHVRSQQQEEGVQNKDDKRAYEYGVILHRLVRSLDYLSLTEGQKKYIDQAKYILQKNYSVNDVFRTEPGSQASNLQQGEGEKKYTGDEIREMVSDIAKSSRHDFVLLKKLLDKIETL